MQKSVNEITFLKAERGCLMTTLMDHDHVYEVFTETIIFLEELCVSAFSQSNRKKNRNICDKRRRRWIKERERKRGKSQ